MYIHIHIQYCGRKASYFTLLLLFFCGIISISRSLCIFQSWLCSKRLCFSPSWGSSVSWAINTFCQNTAIALRFGPSEIFQTVFRSLSLATVGRCLLRLNVFHKIGIKICFYSWPSLNLSTSVGRTGILENTIIFRKESCKKVNGIQNPNSNQIQTFYIHQFFFFLRRAVVAKWSNTLGYY